MRTYLIKFYAVWPDGKELEIFRTEVEDGDAASALNRSYDCYEANGHDFECIDRFVIDIKK